MARGGTNYDHCPPPPSGTRVPMMVHPDARERLNKMLMNYPEFEGIGYSAFVNRACELAEGEAMQARSRKAKG